MILVIAEKPVLARAIAEAIPGTAQNKDACIYKGDYIITWLYGHILELKEPKDYDESYKHWDVNALPIYFPDWQLKIPEDTGKGISKKSRVNQIGKLLKQADMVIHAGDPDDEGQVLVDELLRWHKYTGKVMRLNTANTTKAALKKALNNMTDNKNHENYGWSAYARSVADLMVGVNLTVLFTCKNNTLLTVGRVQTPTLGLVVNRDKIIEGHIKQKYYEVFCKLDIDGKSVPARYVPNKADPALVEGRIISANYAKTIRDKLIGRYFTGIHISKKKVKEQPPLPFNLVKLQSYCSGHFNYSPQQVLDITQSLRDNHKAITYNRSDCQYLSDEHFDEAKDVLAAVVQNIQYSPAELDPNIKSRCFNSSKISAHFAIIPTDERIDMNKLSTEERNVYLAICKYYLAQFLPNAVKETTNLKIDLGNGAAIESVSTIIISPGYRAIFREVKKDASSDLSLIDPETYQGTATAAEVAEKETKPPSRYTKASLNEDMTCISKYVTDPRIKQLLLSKDDGKEGEKGSIGTSATRSGIIENLIKRGFLEERGKKLISTPLGRELYRILPDEFKKADLTAEWWEIQEEIREGRKPYKTLIESVLKAITGVVHDADSYPRIDNSIIPSRDNRAVLGKCPRCGGNVIETASSFCCANWKSGCKFAIWKKSKTKLFADVKFTPTVVKKLLAGKSVKMKNLTSNQGKKFEANVRLKNEPNSQYSSEFELKFPKK